MGVDFPVAIDNDFHVWRAFSNRYWPAHYFVDAQGRIRFHHFGEGEYERSEQVIRQLLDEARQASNGGPDGGAGKTTASTGAAAGRTTDAVATRERPATLVSARSNDKDL